MKNLQKILHNVGFSDKAALLYLAALELGEATVKELAKRAKVKRTTVYYLLEELTSLMAAYQEAVFLPAESGELHEPRILHDVMPLDWNPQVYERSLSEVPEYMSWSQAVERAREYPSWSESVPDQDSLREILWRTYLARFVWKMKYPLRPKYHRKAGRNYRAIQRILLESGDHCLRKVH